MEALIHGASWACLVLGSLFCLIGGLGLLRLPDFYSRTHGGGITDTLGLALVLIGLMLQGGLSLVSVKLITILVIALLASPTSTHAVAKAAFRSGLQPLTSETKDA